MNMYYNYLKDIPISELYHPTINHVVHMSYYVVTFVNTLFFGLMLYIIWYKSPKAMGAYKHLLFLEIIVSYIVSAISFVWQPILLCPLRAAYCTGFLCFDRILNFVFFQLVEIDCFLVVQIHTLKIVYQIAICYQNDNIIKRTMTNVRCIYSMVVGMFVFAVVLTCVALYPVVFAIDVQQTNAAFIKDVPALAELIATEPTFAGFHPDFSKSSLDLILNIAFGLTAVCPVFITAICGLFYYKMKQLQQHVSVATYAVHVMMLRTMICETVIKFFFVATPCFFFALTIKFELLWGSYTATPAFAVFMMQLFLECLTLLYFIKPYRNYVNWLIFRRKSFQTKHTVVDVKISRARTSSYPLTELPKKGRITSKRFSVFS